MRSGAVAVSDNVITTQLGLAPFSNLPRGQATA